VVTKLAVLAGVLSAMTAPNYLALRDSGEVGFEIGAYGETVGCYRGSGIAGAATLAVLAWYGRRWGFLLVEGVWTLVSGWGLLRSARA